MGGWHNGFLFLVFFFGRASLKTGFTLVLGPFMPRHWGGLLTMSFFLSVLFLMAFDQAAQTGTAGPSAGPPAVPGQGHSTFLVSLR